jgi:HTH-type transcriptional regulator/antitoxin HigA
MNIKPIRTKKDYQRAIERLEVIFYAKPGSKDGDELEILSILIDNYEKTHYPVGFPDPIEAIKFRMEQLNLQQKDLASLVGYKSRVSEILSKKRKLTLHMVRKLHRELSIPTEVLVKEY